MDPVPRRKSTEFYLCPHTPTRPLPDALTIQPVAGEPAKKGVLFVDLGKVLQPMSLTARVAHGALAGGEAGGLDVAAMVVMVEAHALAPSGLTARARAGLVDLAGLTAGRNQVEPAALVAGEYLLSLRGTARISHAREGRTQR
jgi:hypothetical protein